MSKYTEAQSRHIGNCLIPESSCIYNGVKVNWFIGDVNFKRALEIGCASQSDTEFLDGKIISNGTTTIIKKDEIKI